MNYSGDSEIEGSLSGLAIAFVVRSLGRSLSSHLILPDATPRNRVNPNEITALLNVRLFKRHGIRYSSN